VLWPLTQKIISWSNSEIKIWNFESGACLKPFNVGHTSVFTNIIQLSNDKIASNGQDGKIIIWNIENGECFKTIDANSSTVQM